MEDYDVFESKEDYPIPRRISSKFFFGLSTVDMIILVGAFVFCNAVLSPLIGPFLSTSARIFWVNYGPTFTLFALLREDAKTGESGMAFLIDAILYFTRPQNYIYKGEDK